MRRQTITAAFLMVSLTAGTGSAQLATFDVAQEGNALKQLANDIKKLANDEMSIAQRITMLAKLDMEIMRQEAIMKQVISQAKYFPQQAKLAWVGAGNEIVGNWTTPNYYGETTGWSGAVNNGTAPQTGWQAAILRMRFGLYFALDPLGAARNLSRTASVNTFDGAGPVALQTIGNARTQQIQLDAAIARLQTAVIDGANEMNSEVQQLNLLNSAGMLQLRQQQTASTVATAMLEQQTLANKVQRDQIVEEMLFLDQFQRYTVAQPTTWGNAAQSFANYRMAQN